MDCAEEIDALRREVGPLVGGDDRLSFDLLGGQMVVSADVGAVPDAVIVAAAGRAGLHATPIGAGTAAEPGWWRRRGRLVATVASGCGIGVGMLIHGMAAGTVLAALGLSATPGALPTGSVAAYVFATIAGAWFVLPRAWDAARGLRPDMNLLMTIAVAGALALGEVLEAATVSFLFALAGLLESWSVARARNAVRALLDLAPPTARVLDPATRAERSLPPTSVAVGDTVVVRPGERVPLDGIITAGAAAMNTAPMTGESRLSEADVGSEVHAGTIATDGAIEVRVTRRSSDTLLAAIVRRVAEAGRRRAAAERWVDRFARVYTPVVFAAALLIAVLPPLLGFGGWNAWLYRALVLLVIGCPCALVISTPVSVVAGLAAASRHGVLVKGGDILELPARLGAVAFDKTGTLTTGRPRVARVVPLAGHSNADVLAIAASLEARSSHPMASAIMAAVTTAGVDAGIADDVRALPGRGIEGTLSGTPVWLGSHRLLEERGQETAEMHRLANELVQEGLSVVVVGEDGHVCGLVALEDTPRSEAASVVEELKSHGVSRVAMLSGDNRETAAALAGRLGIGEIYAELLPEDKVGTVERLKAEIAAGPVGRQRLVAFVGDGINDAPALAAADLGIAASDGATDAAIETADVVLLASNLSRIPWLMRHSRRVVRTIRGNIAFALAIKAAFVVLTVLGHATLWAAIAADMGASLIVIASGLRLLRA
jgi:Cd2+/Zn2+-exporting ATPase